MKVERIIELLKDLPKDAEVYLADNESYYTIGLTPIYKLRIRKYWHLPDFLKESPSERHYNCWGDWEEVSGMLEEVGIIEQPAYNIEIELADQTPIYYILSD